MSAVTDLMKEVELLGIRPLGLLARLDRGPLPEQGTEFQTSFDVKVGFARDGETGFMILFSIECRSRRTKTERPFARFFYRAAAQYQAKQVWPDEVLMEFATTNATIHIWPYARQFVHSSSTQLGLHPVLLAPFRVRGPQGPPAAAPTGS